MYQAVKKISVALPPMSGAYRILESNGKHEPTQLRFVSWAAVPEDLNERRPDATVLFDTKELIAAGCYFVPAGFEPATDKYGRQHPLFREGHVRLLDAEGYSYQHSECQHAAAKEQKDGVYHMRGLPWRVANSESIRELDLILSFGLPSHLARSLGERRQHLMSEMQRTGERSYE